MLSAMKYEKSAGGIIVSLKDNKLKLLLIKDKKGKWTFPKGLIEKGEKTKTTAIREISEEVGIKKLKYLKKLNPISFLYKWEGKLTQKTVYYFLFQNGGQEKLIPQREEGIIAVKWFSYSTIKKSIGYPKTNIGLLNEINSFITKKFSLYL